MSGGVTLGLLLLLGAYVLGSIPFSWLVARAYGVQDVRKVGSGNVGATNVMRSAGRTAGAAAFVLDFLKGGVASWATGLLTGSLVWAALAASTAVIGHMFPIWLGGKGGKGVATGVGAFMPLAPAAATAGLLMFPLTLLLTRYVSVASIVGAITLGIACFVIGMHPAISWSATLTGVLIVVRHQANLRRLMAGTENRLGQRKTAAP